MCVISYCSKINLHYTFFSKISLSSSRKIWYTYIYNDIYIIVSSNSFFFCTNFKIKIDNYELNISFTSTCPNRTFVREHDDLVSFPVEMFRRFFRLGRRSGSKFEHIAVYQRLRQGRQRHRDLGRLWQPQLLQDLLLHVFHSQFGQERVGIDYVDLILRAIDAVIFLTNRWFGRRMREECIPYFHQWIGHFWPVGYDAAR